MTLNPAPASGSVARIAAVLLGICLLAGCATLPLQEEHRVVSVAHEPMTALAVTTANGPIEVRRSARDDVFVEARIRAVSDERLRDTRIITERDADGMLTVTIDWAGGRRRHNESGSLRIEVPDAHGVTAQSSNGRIHIEGLAGSAVLRSSNGRVTVIDHDGTVDARSSNGRVLLDRVTGDVTATTSNGRIEASGLVGSTALRTSNGSVTLALTEDGSGPVDIVSSNGSVELSVGRAFAGELELSTSRGRVSVAAADTDLRLRSLERHRAVLAFALAGAPSRVRTSNGNIRLRRLGEADEP